MILELKKPKKEKGSTLFLSSILGATIILVAGAALVITSGEQSYTTKQHKKVVSRYVAEAGLAKAVKSINNMYMNNQLNFSQVDNELNNKVIINNEEFKYGERKLGDIHSVAKVLNSSEINSGGKDITGIGMDAVRWILLDTKGYYPNSVDKHKTKTTFSAVYEMSHSASAIFDYSYFVNNWGWFYGNNIVSKGNSRSNGSFDMGGYHPQIWGKPRFRTSNDIDLIEYIDDNCDGNKNNQDGGIYAWDTITGTPSSTGHPKDLYQGMRGKNTTPEVPLLPMPNLNNLATYEKMAQDKGSYIKIGNTIICDGIWGDNETRQHLYLEGTIDQPVEIYGTVVVRGDLIIRGYFTGQGSIYCGRNIYLPQRIIAKNGVSNKEPSTNSEASRENWRDTNKNADLLGLFAKENIVMSDFTNSNWRSQVSSWMSNSKNGSKEDAGLDKIPNTDDFGENDGKWTVEYDTNGNVIPGTGEDIDGDGIYDVTGTLNDFNLASSTFTTNHTAWGGNIPSGVTKFSDVTYWDDDLNKPAVGTGSTNFPEVHAVLYTNHFLGGYIKNDSYNYKDDTSKMQNNTKNIVFFGSVICRNESIIYDSSNIYFYHDDRISADSGKRFNLMLPRVWNPLSIIALDIE